MRRAALPVCLCLGLGLALGPIPGGADDVVPPVLDALLPDGRRTESLAALAARRTLAADEDFAIEEIGRDSHTSHHLVWIRDREVPHRHDRHDLLVVMLAGHGAMQLGDEERPVGEGSVLYVPRGTLHAFRNASGTPAAAYAVYLPAFDGTDRVLESP